MSLTHENFQALIAKYVWPQVPPKFDKTEWSLDGGGRQLVLNRIQTGEPFLIIEIGVFLGASVKQSMVCNIAQRVCDRNQDPWEGEQWADYARKHGRDLLAEQFSRESGPYMTFLSFMWGFKDRLQPVRGTSPEKLYELVGLGIQPDLVYFDSNKTGNDNQDSTYAFPRCDPDR